MSSDTGRKTEALHALARQEYENQQSTHTRRRLLRAAGIAGAGAITLTAATGSVSADPQGVLEGTSSGDPLLKIRIDRMVLVARTSDVSSPADGTTWYRGDL